MVLKELRWRTSEFDGETTPFYATACFWELCVCISRTLFLEFSSHQGHIGKVGRELIISGIGERTFCWLFSTMEITGNRLALSAIIIDYSQFESECDILAREGDGKLSMARWYEKHDYNLKKIWIGGNTSLCLSMTMKLPTDYVWSIFSDLSKWTFSKNVIKLWET